MDHDYADVEFWRSRIKSQIAKGRCQADAVRDLMVNYLLSGQVKQASWFATILTAMNSDTPAGKDEHYHCSKKAEA